MNFYRVTSFRINTNAYKLFRLRLRLIGDSKSYRDK